MEKIFHANENKTKQKSWRVAILRQIYFKTNTVTIDKEVYYIMMKGSI